MKICNCWSVEPNDTWLLVEAKRLGGGGTTGGGPGLPNATGGSDYRFGDIVCSPGGGKSGYDKRIDPNKKSKVIGFDQEGVNDNNEKVGNKRIESKPSLKNVENGCDILDITSKIVSVVGFKLGFEENSRVINNMWRGKNGGWYRLGWKGNQWTGSGSKVIAKANMFKIAGRTVFYIGGAISFAQGGIALYNSDYDVAFKKGFDIGMGALATFGGPVGIIFGGTYFLLDALDAFEPSNVPRIYQYGSFIQDNTNVNKPIIFK